MWVEVIIVLSVLCRTTLCQQSQCQANFYRTSAGECRKCDVSCVDCIGPTSIDCTNCASGYEFYTAADDRKVCTSSAALQASKTAGTIIAIVVVVSYFVICALFCVIIAISAKRKARQQEMEMQQRQQRNGVVRNQKLIEEPGVPISTLGIKLPEMVQILPKFYKPNPDIEAERLEGVSFHSVVAPQQLVDEVPVPADEKDIEVQIGSIPAETLGNPLPISTVKPTLESEPVLVLPELQPSPSPAYILY